MQFYAIINTILWPLVLYAMVFSFRQLRVMLFNLEAFCSFLWSFSLFPQMITVDFPLFLQHIDKIMSTHGKQIMQAVTLILEGEHNIEVKEQVCVPPFFLTHFFPLRNIFWVWIPRRIFIRSLLKYSDLPRTECWDGRCYRDKKGLRRMILHHPWFFSQNRRKYYQNL